MPAKNLFDPRIIAAFLNAYLEDRLKGIWNTMEGKIEGSITLKQQEKIEGCEQINSYFYTDNHTLPANFQSGEQWKERLNTLHEFASKALSQSADSHLAATIYLIINFCINRIKASEQYDVLLAPELPEDPTLRKANTFYLHVVDKHLVYTVLNSEGTWKENIRLDLPVPEKLDQPYASSLKDMLINKASEAGHIDISFSKMVEKLKRENEALKKMIDMTKGEIRASISKNEPEVAKTKRIQKKNLKKLHRESLLQLVNLGDMDALCDAVEKKGFFPNYFIYPRDDMKCQNVKFNPDIPLLFHKEYPQVHYEWHIQPILGSFFGKQITFEDFVHPDNVAKYSPIITGKIVKDEKQEKLLITKPSTPQLIGNTVLSVGSTVGGSVVNASSGVLAYLKNTLWSTPNPPTNTISSSEITVPSTNLTLTNSGNANK